MSERKEWISPLAHLALTPLMRRALCAEAAERLRGPRPEGKPVEGLKERVEVAKAALGATKPATKIRRKGATKIKNATEIRPDATENGDATKKRGRPKSEVALTSTERSRLRRAAKRGES